MQSHGRTRVLLYINGLLLGVLLGGMLALWLDGMEAGRTYLAKASRQNLAEPAR